jgi:phage gpG-like protein
MIIKGEIKGVAAAKAKVSGVAPRAVTKIVTAIKTEAINLVAYIKQNKLSDQVLRVRTGRLRRSITANFAQDGDTFAARIGTNVKYGRAWEFGFTGAVNVPEHKVKAFERMQTHAFGKPMKSPRKVNVREHVVKAHTVNMKMDPRPFVGPSAEENMPRIQKNLRQAMAEALR